jgi:hypothetical protein
MARWAGLDDNPLRRGIDRVERAVWLLLAVAFLVAAPMLVPLAGRMARVDGIGEVRRERLWRQVNAVLVRRAADRFDGYGADGAVWVQGRWRAPSGAARIGLVPVAPGAPAGTVVRIWVDRAGRVTGRPPVTVGLVTVRVIAVEVLALTGLAFAALLFAGFVRWVLNRRRMTVWDSEWACFGPRWTTRH